jgi:predicted GNAT superfamily acetyltransferase
MEMKRKHFELTDILHYIRTKEYPFEVKQKGDQSNFRRACKKFNLENGQFFYNDRVVIIDEERQNEIIKDVHEGLGESNESKAMASHRGINTTYDNVSSRFFGILSVEML